MLRAAFLLAFGVIVSACVDKSQVSELEIRYADFYYDIPFLAVELNDKEAFLVVDTGAQSVILQESFVTEHLETIELLPINIDFGNGVKKIAQSFSGVELVTERDGESDHVVSGYIDSIAMLDQLNISGTINPAKLSSAQCTVIDFHYSLVRFFDDTAQCKPKQSNKIRLSDSYISNAEINGKMAQRVLFDTGAPITYISGKYEKEGSLKLGNVRMHTYYGLKNLDVIDGSELKIGSSIFQFDKIAVARHTLPKNVDAVVGMDLLDKTIIHIDKRNGISLSLSPNVDQSMLRGISGFPMKRSGDPD